MATTVERNKGSAPEGGSRRLLTIRQAMEFFAQEGYPVGRNAIYERIKRGRLTPVRVQGGKGKDVRFWREDLEEYVRAEREIERMERECWGIAELADFLGYTTDHAYVVVREQQIPHTKARNGRMYFDPDSVVAHLRERQGERDPRGRPRSGEPPAL